MINFGVIWRQKRHVATVNIRPNERKKSGAARLISFGSMVWVSW